MSGHSAHGEPTRTGIFPSLLVFLRSGARNSTAMSERAFEGTDRDSAAKDKAGDNEDMLDVSGTNGNEDQNHILHSDCNSLSDDKDESIETQGINSVHDELAPESPRHCVIVVPTDRDQNGAT
jgi:hypothetical protein